MEELSTKLGFRHDNSTPYYPQDDDQVEEIKKVLKTMLQRMVGKSKSNCHLQLFSTLWAYRITVKTSNGFTLFKLVYGLEATLPIECKIPSLNIVVELLPNTTIEEE